MLESIHVLHICRAAHPVSRANGKSVHPIMKHVKQKLCQIGNTNSINNTLSLKFKGMMA